VDAKRIGGYQIGDKIIWGVTKDQARMALAKHELATWFARIAGADGQLTVEKLMAAVGRDPVTMAKAIQALAPAGTIRPRAPREPHAEVGANGGKRRGRPPKAPPAEPAQPQEAA